MPLLLWTSCDICIPRSRYSLRLAAALSTTCRLRPRYCSAVTVARLRTPQRSSSRRGSLTVSLSSLARLRLNSPAARTCSVEMHTACSHKSCTVTWSNSYAPGAGTTTSHRTCLRTTTPLPRGRSGACRPKLPPRCLPVVLHATCESASILPSVAMSGLLWLMFAGTCCLCRCAVRSFLIDRLCLQIPRRVHGR